MKVRLICSDNIKYILLELLSARNIFIDDQSEICIIEAGYTPPDNLVCILFHPSNMNPLMELLNKLMKANYDNNKIIGRSDDERYKVIPLGQIHYFEGRGNNTFCITEDGEYRVKEKLYGLESRLPQNQFVRVGKSFVVNISNVEEIIPWFGRRLVLKFINSKKEIEVSKNFVKSFKDFLGI